MNVPAKRALRRLRHLDLLALAIEVQVAPAESQVLRFASLSRDQLIDALTRTGPMARLAERAGKRLTP